MRSCSIPCRIVQAYSRETVWETPACAPAALFSSASAFHFFFFFFVCYLQKALDFFPEAPILLLVCTVGWLPAQRFTMARSTLISSIISARIYRLHPVYFVLTVINSALWFLAKLRFYDWVATRVERSSRRRLDFTMRIFEFPE